MGNFTLADAIRIAEFGHFHQRDKAGEPYIKHPMRVLDTLQQQGAQPYVQMAGVLHDVTEDFKYTRITLDMLRTFGVPDAAVEIVRLCDRNASKKVWEERNQSRDYLVDSWSSLDEAHYSQVMGEWVENNFGSVAAIDDPDVFYYWEIKKNPGAVQVKLADIGDNQQPWRVVYLPVEKQTELEIKYTKAKRLLRS